jgi:hypothetical protein
MAALLSERGHCFGLSTDPFVDYGAGEKVLVRQTWPSQPSA